MKRISIFLITITLVAGIVGCSGGNGPDPYADYIKIYDWTDLDNVRNSLVAKYVLMNDLDSTTVGYEEMASPTANGEKGWQPIGSFAGILDGQGYEISDLFIDRSEEDYVGLFGYVGEGGVIRDIGARNVVVMGYHYVGGLVGCNDGTLSDSYFIGSVNGDEYFGGLVGYDSGNTISNSYYNHEESLINGENMITTGALSDEDFEEWLANSKFLDVSERLSFEDGYYLIESVSNFKELLAFGQDAALKFRLVNDLDLSGEPNFYIPYLAGEFDGDGHTISNLSLNLSAVTNLGLFGYLIPGGNITELGVVNVNVTGKHHVGGLVGDNEGTVSNSYSTGSVTGYEAVGGLVGQVGADAGNAGTVSNSYSTCNVIGELENIGGLVGDNKGTVSNSYAIGNVIGYKAVGGLAGYNRGLVSNSYSTGSVIGYDGGGGLVGAYAGGTVTNSFWDTETSGQSTSDGGTGKTTAEMQDISTFSGAMWDIVAVANPSIRNISYIWNIVDNETYPLLSWQSNVPINEELGKSFLCIFSTDGGEVTEPGEAMSTYDKGTVVNLIAEADEGCHFVNWNGNIDTITNVEAATTNITMNGNYFIWACFGDLEIRDWYDLDAIRDSGYPFGGHYILVNDLDSTTVGYEELASPTANQGKGWEPINGFGGIFNGQGYEIRDLFINRPNDIHDGVGLFQWIGIGVVIKNVSVVNVDVTGKHHVGGLVGDNEGTVSNSYSTGSVTGYEAVGGLVGQVGADAGNAGTVSNSYSTCSVTGELERIGGLVGHNKGSVSNSYSTGSVTGISYVGGLLGDNIGTVNNSFWDIETSGQAISDGGTGKTTAEMQDITTFSGATWDIVAVVDHGTRNLSYIWNIVDDETYPFLSWQPAS